MLDNVVIGGMNILTFDIEEWYLESVKLNRPERYKQLDEAFIRVLDDLDRHGMKGTFFCVGQLAVTHPWVIREIVERGHELGCHSNIHTWLDKMTPEELRDDTTESLKALEDVSGQKIVSYRAPAFSITPKNKWAVNVLAECGIKNDASIFPTNRDFGGYKGFPQDTPCIISHEGATLREYPISLMSFIGKKIAYSGGGYFRLMPYWFVDWTIKRRDYNICYFHLADLILTHPQLMTKQAYEEYFKEPGTLKNRLIRYAKSNAGRGDVFGKLKKLLSDNQFVNIQQADEMLDWEQLPQIIL
jgi:polysaccharide deacetylase family protein (PEP-CTERM system associated)